MANRVSVNTADVHKLLVRDQGGWMDIVPGSLKFVYVSLLEAGTGTYLQEFGSYMFTTQDEQIFHIPAEAMIGLQVNPTVEPPIEDPEGV